MKTITRKTQLQSLEKELQQKLYQAGFEITRFQIECTLKSETFLVICEHPPAPGLNGKRVLVTLQNALTETPPEGAKQVGLCLRLQGQTQPYAFHSFPIQPLPAISESAEMVSAPEPENETPGAGETATPDPIASNLTSDHLNPVEDLEENPFDPKDLELLLIEPEIEAPAPDLSGEPEAQLETKATNKYAPQIMGVVLAATLALLGGVYAITPPCVIDSCEVIEEAQQLNQDYAQTLEAATSLTGTREAREQLQTAINHLKTVPFWSLHYPKTRSLLNGYERELTNVETVVTALTTATAAAEHSKNPPHSTQQWQKIRTLWEEAITQLKSVEPDSFAYVFAQSKINQYQGHFGSIQQRLDAEQEGETLLNQAKKAAQIAEAREGVAQFVDSWRLVISSWKVALNRLAEIPEGTTAYQESQKLLPVYQQQLNKVEQRVRIEELGSEAYNQAINSALQAQVFEGRDSWSLAVQSWQRAVNAAQQVPASSAYGTKIQPLLQSYEISLQQAQSQQRIAARLQKAHQDLGKTCGGSPTICDYTVGRDLVTVRLTVEYMRKLQDTSQDQEALKKHANALGLALKAISENAQVPVELYNPQGKRIDVHVP